MIPAVGSAALDWPRLGFEYRQTHSFVRYKFRDGAWDDGEELPGSTPEIPVHIGATALHYGQSLFEGLKAFHCKDGKVRLFRPHQNAKRMARGAERTLMQAPSEALFVDACKRVVRANLAYVPPYGSGGSLYVRPLLFGSGARIGLQPADAYDFIVLTTPVAAYYQGGLSPVKARVIDECDRAAPRGVGSVKLAGNYAPDLRPNLESKKLGYPIGLYLDAETRTFVEEFSTSNFFGIKENSYVTPQSSAILPSITNDALMTIAEHKLGLTVERRPVTFEEVADFDEVAACGTAVVITPVSDLVRDDAASLVFPKEDRQRRREEDESCAPSVGPVSKQLYEYMTEIQTGDRPDDFGWLVDVLDDDGP